VKAWLLALNVSSDFAKRTYVLFAKVLRTPLAIRNTWGATPWEDSTLPASILEEKENQSDDWFSFFVFLSAW
jgi:hypothetical protein